MSNLLLSPRSTERCCETPLSDVERLPADVGWPASAPTVGKRGSSLRVTHLGKYFHPAHGDIERTVRTLAHAQARLGYSVRVICRDHEPGWATRIEQDGPIEVVRVRRAVSFCKIDHCPDLPHVLRDSEADLMHLHTPNPTMIFALLLCLEKLWADNKYRNRALEGWMSEHGR
jgi:hypothetical protein